MQIEAKKFNQRVRDYNRSNPIRYSEGAKKRGDKKSKFESAKFLAWDGEGTQPDGKTQVYSLLANSDRDYIINQEGLSTQHCLNFLTSEKYTNNCIHVCFGASYDVNMMLRDVPEHLLIELHKGDNPIEWEQFRLEYRPRKSFTIKKYKTEIRNGKEYKCYDERKDRFIFEKTVVLWDVFGFFGAKFVKVLEEWIQGTRFQEKYTPVINDIKTGKDKRGSFKESELISFVLPYCLNECEALRDIMIILHEYLTEAGLVLSRWDGAGAVAAACMKKYNIKKHIRNGLMLQYECYPEEVIEAGEFAYFGGWIECFMFGHIDWPIFHYDLRSAYPSVTVDLPSLSMGHWEELDFGVNWLTLSEVISLINKFPSFWLGHIEWENGPIYGPGPFSWRNHRGTVSRPVQGIGWQWGGEILSAYKLFPKLKIKIGKIFYFVPDENNEKPFAFINDLYKLRDELKKAGKGIQMVYKLAMNSIYGKLAQSLGYNKERGLKPPYHCILYAGYITSETRRKLLEAAMQYPLAIISIATDGIYSLQPLTLDIGSNLGQWEFSEHESMTIVQPGFYWYSSHKTNKYGLEELIENHYYRGFNEGSITREQVIEAYNIGQSSLPVSTTRFITLGAAIGLANFKYWRTWRTVDRSLDLIMAKSSKRIWKGDTFVGNSNIKIARNKVIKPEFFKEHPDLLHSLKYQFDWDENGDEEYRFFDGQSLRQIAEEMFHMELSPM